MERVTGIGGVFIIASDPKGMAAWYQKHLGIEFGDSVYTSFKWVNQNNPDVPGSTVFSFFNQGTSYLEPSKSSYMINFRVKNLETLIPTLKEEGVTVVGDIQSFDYGKFCWILDPENNKIELWEPVD